MRIYFSSGFVVAAVLLGSVFISGASVSGGHAAPQPPAHESTPVLGRSLLSAQQLASWYESARVESRSRTPVNVIAQLFIEEGNAQGVRGDLAFAQSMLETGYLRYGGQVLPSDNNFSGLGACDKCKRGLAFPDARTGVRAQIQHLWAYASPDARADATARPNVDIRFDLVTPKGKAATWEQMGGGNWATDPDYAQKVLGIYRGMLAWAGVVDVSPTGPPPIKKVVKVNSSGGAFIAGWAPHMTGLAGAHDILGAPTSTQNGTAGCLIRWRTQGVAALTDSRCDATAPQIRWVWMGAGWRTQRGIAVGAKLKQLVARYPRAKRPGTRRVLVIGRDPNLGAARVRLAAEIRSGQVRALLATPRTIN